MQWKHVFWSIFAVLFPFFGQVCASQSVPSARAGSGQSFSVGLGPSGYNVDWGHGRMLGGAVWADWQPAHVPSLLYGLGLEMEAQDISLNQSSSQPSNFRLDTIGGGLIYHWPHYRNFHPYVKALAGYGSLDFTILSNPNYTHDTRTVYAPGGGFDFRAYGPIWARVDYEYQVWPDLFGGHTLDPQGFTLGVAYAFGTGGFRH